MPLLTVLMLYCVPPCFSSAPQASTQSSPTSSELNLAKADVNSYTFVMPPTLTPPGVEFDDQVHRPFIYWRAWVNQKLPYSRVIRFLLVIGLALQFLFGKLLVASKEDYEQRWLRCLGVGVLVMVVSGTLTGSAARMGFFMPLATLIQGITQGLSLLGMTLAAESLGLSCIRAARLESKLQKPWLARSAYLLIGILLLSLFVFIPGIGQLPRLGNRILALFGAAGLGAICIHLHSKRTS